MFQRLKIDDLPLAGNLLKEYDSENIGMIGGYCEEGFPTDTKSQLEIANAASAAKSAFLFNISHDIRTPVNL